MRAENDQQKRSTGRQGDGCGHASIIALLMQECLAGKDGPMWHERKRTKRGRWQCAGFTMRVMKGGAGCMEKMMGVKGDVMTW